ncbi:MAG: NAD(P)/FAD-dependent oxidoreductase [Pyrinomonadaceae bacterium]|nr:NAD(P)/FAD-dependent oxidoreductase [Pyrinomonadaceae bacterium]
MNNALPYGRATAPGSAQKQEWDVIIIGGGAAGLFSGIVAGKRGRKVLVIEHAERVGKKIGISGGGRCNFTNTGTGPDNFISANPHFCKSALARYTPADFIALVEKHGIAYHQKKLGQLFCDGSSQQIIDMLLRECQDAGVEIRCGCEVAEVRGSARAFTIQTNQGSFQSSSLVIATGGLSIAPLGATDFGYRVARQFGLRIEETRAGLVPLTLPPRVQKQLTKLSGISIDALVGRQSLASSGRARNAPVFRENILITHRGLSGPAILQISTYWRPGESISINLLPEANVMEIISSKLPESGAEAEIELVTLLSRYLPRRFAQAWCELYHPSRPVKQYNSVELQEIAAHIHNLQLTPSGTEGFRKAEVTAGGVSTAELSSQTMEAKRVPGLYFIGEVVDVTGQLGGYNFQWAWASGYAAGQVV